jgi:hypothetical protein
MQNNPMPRLISFPLVLILTTMIHVDWHFARPHQHRLSLEWSSHWLLGMAFFAVAGGMSPVALPSSSGKPTLLVALLCQSGFSPTG